MLQELLRLYCVTIRHNKERLSFSADAYFLVSLFPSHVCCCRVGVVKPLVAIMQGEGLGSQHLETG